MLKRRIAMSTVLLMALCFTGCTDKQLSKANKLVLDYAATIKVAEKAVAVGESTTIILNGKETKIIPMNSASSLMTLLNRANTAGKTAGRSACYRSCVANRPHLLQLQGLSCVSCRILMQRNHRLAGPERAWRY